MKTVLRLFAFPMLILTSLKGAAQNHDVLWKTKTYTIYSDSVVQGTYTAKALSATEIISNYKSPANLFQPAKIVFKFSINGKDNEMQPGVDHHFNVVPGVSE